MSEKIHALWLFLLIPLLGWVIKFLSLFIDPKKNPPERKVFFAGLILAVLTGLLFWLIIGMPTDMETSPWIVIVLTSLGWSGGYGVQLIAEGGIDALKKFISKNG